MSESQAVVLAAAITASGAIIAAIITGLCKKLKNKDEKNVTNIDNKVIVIPPEPSTRFNPFDLKLSDQEFGEKEYFEAMGTQLMSNRTGEDLHIRRIEK